jgi:hypothetical protein
VVCTQLLQHVAAVNAVHQDVFVMRRVKFAFAQQAFDKIDGAHFRNQRGVEGDLIEPVQNFHRAGG